MQDDMSQEASGIKLMVSSAEDVTMLSAFLQDALIAHHDIFYDKARSEVVLVADRYRWEQDASRAERVLMGLRIAKVSALLQKNMPQSGTSSSGPMFYNLLNLSYEEEEAGEKFLCFTFSAGRALRLVIDDLTMSAADLAPPRPAIATPHHADVMAQDKE